MISNIICLLDPAFDKSVTNPGYIKGYVAGVRENGGQYSHAAIWMIIAFTKLGDSEKAWELFKMVNPINHGRTPEEIAVYKVEPYVLAGDVYAVSPHQGHGGWTWYTGSAGWMNQLITDHFFELLSWLKAQAPDGGTRVFAACSRSNKDFSRAFSPMLPFLLIGTYNAASP